jgi:hypothetical protein
MASSRCSRSRSRSAASRRMLSRERWRARGTRWPGARRGPGWPALLELVCLGHVESLVAVGGCDHFAGWRPRTWPRADPRPRSPSRGGAAAAAPRRRRCARPRAHAQEVAGVGVHHRVVDDDEGLVAERKQLAKHPIDLVRGRVRVGLEADQPEAVGEAVVAEEQHPGRRHLSGWRAHHRWIVRALGVSLIAGGRCKCSFR